MSAKPRRRRQSGSLGQLKGCLWAVIRYNVGLVEDETVEHELRLKGSSTLVQAALAYARIVEMHDVENQVRALEQLASGNGHHA